MAFAELKARQSVMWGNGPYERITETITDMHELVIGRLDPQPGVDFLDEACGTGAVALLAAERGANVTGMDLAPALIERAKELAAERGLDIRFDVGDVEDLSYGDASFDAVSSTCGVMFAPTMRPWRASWLASPVQGDGSRSPVGRPTEVSASSSR